MSAVSEGAIQAGEPARLGEVLIQRGLLAEDQLTAALEEQQRSGRPLGETLVTLGFVAAPVIAQALATQHGGMLKTEYGFATGFAPDGAAPAAVAPPAPPALADAPPPPTPMLRVASAQPEAPKPVQAAPDPVQEAAPEPVQEAAPERAVAAVPDPRDDELRQLREQVAALEAVLEGARKSVTAVTAERDAAVETVQRLEQQASDSPPEGGTLEAEMAGRAELNERITSLQQRLDEAFAQLTELRNVREELAQATEARDSALARVGELEAELTELRSAAEAAPEESEELAQVTEARDSALARVGELEAELTEARSSAVAATETSEQLAQATEARDSALARVGELEAELAEARAAAAAAQETVAPERAPEIDEPRFLALVPTAQGYQLLELEGRAPAVGSRVEVPEELGGTVREVLSVGGSPLPASALRCVHLI
jgi:DNA repair exonuclease SbcCD ATPase subunit